MESTLGNGTIERMAVTSWLVAAVLLLAPAPALAQDVEPIPGARDWKMQTALPGVPYTPCTARADGPQADTMLLLNNAGEPILAAGRGDWADLSGDATVTLSIDGGPPEPMKVSFAHNLMLAAVDDAAQLARLRIATTLDWVLPFGRFRANVAGLGVALDAILACRSNGPVTAG